MRGAGLHWSEQYSGNRSGSPATPPLTLDPALAASALHGSLRHQGACRGEGSGECSKATWLQPVVAATWLPTPHMARVVHISARSALQISHGREPHAHLAARCRRDGGPCCPVCHGVLHVSCCCASSSFSPSSAPVFCLMCPRSESRDCSCSDERERRMALKLLQRRCLRA